MRILSVQASTACIPLAGRLVRHHGAIACVAAAGILAIYPADIVSARTLLLEPWMNPAVLLANAAFRDSQLKSPSSCRAIRAQAMTALAAMTRPACRLQVRSW
jgi:hypothetical protein